MGYRLVIAEDEEMERSALRLIIRTQLPQYEIAAQAANGVELMEMCREYKPDVVLMDISMPVLNGLDAMRQLQASYPNLEFIVLSAHADFEYAKTALQLGAFDYLTKPIKTDVLLSALTRLAERIRSNTIDGCRDDHLNEQIRLALPQLEYNIVQSIITDTVTDLDLRRFQARFRTENACFLCATASPLQIQQPAFFHQDELLSEIGRQLDLCTRESIVQDIGICHIFILSVDQDQFSRNIPQFTYELRCLLSAVYQKHRLEQVCLYISPAVFSLSELSAEFKALNKKMLKGHRQVVLSAPNGSAKIYALETELSQSVSKGDSEKSLEKAKLLFQALLEQSNRTPALLCDNLRDSLGALKRHLTTMDSGSILISGLCNDLLSTISPRQNTDYIKIAFLNFIKACCDCCEGNEPKDTDDIDIKKIITYINSNYTSDFSLEQLAMEHKVSPSYLSKALKHQLGMNFIDYITKLRIDKAIKLLEQSDKNIKEITFAVGYNSQTYFCKVFKKIVGISASEYKAGVRPF